MTLLKINLDTGTPRKFEQIYLSDAFSVTISSIWSTWWCCIYSFRLLQYNNAVHICKTHDYIYIWSFKRGDNRHEIIPLYIHITVTVTRTTQVEISVLIRILLRRHRNSNLYGRFYAYSTKDITVSRSPTRDRFSAFLYPSYAAI